MVCSEEYKLKPAEDPVNEKTMIMSHLDKPNIEEQIKTIINQINTSNVKDWPEYYQKLKRYFDID